MHMLKSIFLRFNLFPIIFFVVLEVFLFGQNIISQTIVSAFVYFVLIVLTLNNVHLAIAYYISFSLLSFGTWSYIVDDLAPGNFWGLRIFDVSVNFIFSIFILFILILKLKNFKRNQFPIEINFFFIFFIFSFFVGILNTSFKINYYDNFLKDLIVYTPIFILSFLVFSINDDLSIKIFKYCIISTFIGMLLSLIFGIFFEYGSDFKFILLNSFGFIILVIIPFCKKQFPTYQFYILLIIAAILAISGNFFTGGKFIIILFFGFFWYLLIFKRKIFLTSFLLLFLIFIFSFWELITIFLMNLFEDNFIIQYKLSQVISIIDILDIETLSKTPTSIGNIFAESSTIFHYYILHPFKFITGLGFGGGIPDLYGYLSPLAKPGLGYSEIDASRDNFFRMHLPIFEFVLKFGIFGFFGFIFIAIKSFKNNNIFSFFFFLVFFTVFTNNKEMILLAFLFLRLSNNKSTMVTQ